MKYRIQAMTTEDINAVLAMWNSIEGIGLDDDCDSVIGITKYIARNPDQSYVAYDNNKLVGAVLCGHDGRRGYLHHLAVVEECRDLGIGTALMNKCLSSLSKQGIPKCNIFLFLDNENGRLFWEHTGWNMRKDLAVLQKMT